ncbi:MAG: hypothetical protein HY430_03715 [Candidatus Levybacteria bacterium]|nr:hypothetical protein [Candidatus Levybacteria bacterium]
MRAENRTVSQPVNVVQENETDKNPEGLPVLSNRQTIAILEGPPPVFPPLPGIDSQFIQETVAQGIPGFLLRDAPMPDITPASERERRTDEELNTPYHELFHGFAAIGVQKKYGIIAPVSLSVHPDEKSKGRAVVYGQVEKEHLKVIAAAGLINPPGTKARGAGGDIAFIDKTIEEIGGKTRDESYKEAFDFVKGYSVPVLRRAAEILAKEGMLTPNQVARLPKQAAWELYQEGVPLHEINAVFVTNNTIEWSDEQWLHADDYTVIENLGNAQYHIVSYWDKGPEWFLCGRCQSFYDQEHNCPGITNEDILPVSTVEELVHKTYPTDVFIAKAS